MDPLQRGLPLSVVWPFDDCLAQNISADAVTAGATAAAIPDTGSGVRIVRNPSASFSSPVRSASPLSSSLALSPGAAAQSALSALPLPLPFSITLYPRDRLDGGAQLLSIPVRARSRIAALNRQAASAAARLVRKALLGAVNGDDDSYGEDALDKDGDVGVDVTAGYDDVADPAIVDSSASSPSTSIDDTHGAQLLAVNPCLLRPLLLRAVSIRPDGVLVITLTSGEVQLHGLEISAAALPSVGQRADALRASRAGVSGVVSSLLSSALATFIGPRPGDPVETPTELVARSISALLKRRHLAHFPSPTHSAAASTFSMPSLSSSSTATVARGSQQSGGASEETAAETTSSESQMTAAEGRPLSARKPAALSSSSFATASAGTSAADTAASAGKAHLARRVVVRTYREEVHDALDPVGDVLAKAASVPTACSTVDSSLTSSCACSPARSACLPAPSALGALDELLGRDGHRVFSVATASASRAPTAARSGAGSNAGPLAVSSPALALSPAQTHDVVDEFDVAIKSSLLAVVHLPFFLQPTRTLPHHPALTLNATGGAGGLAAGAAWLAGPSSLGAPVAVIRALSGPALYDPVPRSSACALSASCVERFADVGAQGAAIASLSLLLPVTRAASAPHQLSTAPAAGSSGPAPPYASGGPTSSSSSARTPKAVPLTHGPLHVSAASLVECLVGPVPRPFLLPPTAVAGPPALTSSATALCSAPGAAAGSVAISPDLIPVLPANHSTALLAALPALSPGTRSPKAHTAAALPVSAPARWVVAAAPTGVFVSVPLLGSSRAPAYSSFSSAGSALPEQRVAAAPMLPLAIAPHQGAFLAFQSVPAFACSLVAGSASGAVPVSSGAWASLGNRSAGAGAGTGVILYPFSHVPRTMLAPAARPVLHVLLAQRLRAVRHPDEYAAVLAMFDAAVPGPAALPVPTTHGGSPASRSVAAASAAAAAAAAGATLRTIYIDLLLALALTASDADAVLAGGRSECLCSHPAASTAPTRTATSEACDLHALISHTDRLLLSPPAALAPLAPSLLARTLFWLRSVHSPLPRSRVSLFRSSGRAAGSKAVTPTIAASTGAVGASARASAAPQHASSPAPAAYCRTVLPSLVALLSRVLRLHERAHWDPLLALCANAPSPAAAPALNTGPTPASSSAMPSASARTPGIGLTLHTQLLARHTPAAASAPPLPHPSPLPLQRLAARIGQLSSCAQLLYVIERADGVAAALRAAWGLYCDVATVAAAAGAPLPLLPSAEQLDADSSPSRQGQRRHSQTSPMPSALPAAQAAAGVGTADRNGAMRGGDARGDMRGRAGSAAAVVCSSPAAQREWDALVSDPAYWCAGPTDPCEDERGRGGDVAMSASVQFVARMLPLRHCWTLASEIGRYVVLLRIKVREAGELSLALPYAATPLPSSTAAAAAAAAAPTSPDLRQARTVQTRVPPTPAAAAGAVPSRAASLAAIAASHFPAPAAALVGRRTGDDDVVDEAATAFEVALAEAIAGDVDGRADEQGEDGEGGKPLEDTEALAAEVVANALEDATDDFLRGSSAFSLGPGDVDAAAAHNAASGESKGRPSPLIIGLAATSSASAFGAPPSIAAGADDEEGVGDAADRAFTRRVGLPLPSPHIYNDPFAGEPRAIRGEAVEQELKRIDELKSREFKPSSGPQVIDIGDGDVAAAAGNLKRSLAKDFDTVADAAVPAGPARASVGAVDTSTAGAQTGDCAIA